MTHAVAILSLISVYVSVLAFIGGHTVFGIMMATAAVVIGPGGFWLIQRERAHEARRLGA